MKRGGLIVNEKVRIHLREHWVNTITLMLAQAIEEIETKRFMKYNMLTNLMKRIEPEDSLENNNSMHKERIRPSFVIWNMDY